MKKNHFDYIGQQHGFLKIISVCQEQGKRAEYFCICKCGNEKYVQVGNISRTHSCGCFRKQFSKEMHTKHGQSKRTKAYEVWVNMKTRCSNPNSTFYLHYGGRGIKVCERWQNFENFYKDMGDVPSKLTIERIDVNKDYEPSNCKWASKMEQAANKRNNRFLIIDNEKIHLMEASRRFNLNFKTIWQRLKRGWSDEDAVKIPVRIRKHSNAKI
jgi:hypothetical protein